MPTNIFFIITLGIVIFILVSIILIPIFNKGNRSKITRIVDDIYNVDDEQDVSDKEFENIKNKNKLREELEKIKNETK